MTPAGLAEHRLSRSIPDPATAWIGTIRTSFVFARVAVSGWLSRSQGASRRKSLPDPVSTHPDNRGVCLIHAKVSKKDRRLTDVLGPLRVHGEVVDSRKALQDPTFRYHDCIVFSAWSQPI
jgi:hypothetical protein